MLMVKNEKTSLSAESHYKIDTGIKASLMLLFLLFVSSSDF